MVAIYDGAAGDPAQIIALQQENAALKEKVIQAEEENRKQMEIQQRLGEITNNYLMLHYLNKNIQDCGSSQQIWETYLRNIGDGGFAYSNVCVLLPDEKGNFHTQKLLVQGVLQRQEIEGLLEKHVTEACEQRIVCLSEDNLKVAVPMINNCGELIAVLCAEKKRGIFFEDVQLLEVYVQQTVATIENVMLNERLYQYQELLGKRMDQFVMLHYIAQEINESKGYYDLLERYLKIISSPLGLNFTQGVLYVLDEEKIHKASLLREQLYVEANASLDHELVAEALEEKMTVYDSARKEVALPLRSFGKINAILYVKHDECIETEQVQILETFARQTSATLENTRLNMDLEYISFHDALTQLYNRAFFEQEVRRIEEEKLFPLGMVMCDADGLKLVNDGMGHSAGDEVIRASARFMQQAVSDDRAIVARIGGDEFIILLPHVAAETLPGIVAQIQANAEAYNRSGDCIPVWLSIGWAYSNKPVAIADLFKEADQMLYEDKYQFGPARRELIRAGIEKLTVRKIMEAE